MRKQLSGIGKAFRIVQNADKIYPLLLLARALAASLAPLYTSVCLSRLISGLAGERRIDSIILGLSLLLLGVLLFRALEAWLEWQCSYRYMRMQDIFTAKNSMKAMKMEYPATESSEVADLYVNAWRANMSPGAILEQFFFVFGGAIQILGCIGILLRLGSVLLGAQAAFIALYCFLDYRMGIRRREYELEAVPFDRAISYTRGCMGDVDCAKDIRLYYPQSFFLNRLGLYQKQKIEKEWSREHYCGRVLSLQAALQMLQTFVLYTVLICRFLQGGIEIGYFSLTVSSIGIFMGAVKGISAAWNQIIKNVVFLDYLERFRSLPERFEKDCGREEAAHSEEAANPEKAAQHKALSIEFKDVWFRYPGAEKYSLEAVNVTLDQGEVMTVVGENGSGKTTFVKLLLGLYRPTRGEILLDGVNIDRYSDEEYRAIFAPVFQDYRLFAYTIRENLVFDREYPRAEAETLLAELGLDKKINSLPNGIEQYVGKGYEKSGVDFSGGEKQKLAIARALLKGGACVVLDEPTAALDPIAEMELYRQIDRMAGEKSCVFITHRLAGVRLSSRILYFENGRIAEQGSCQELLEKEGKFYEFYQLQAKLYLRE